MQLQLQLQLWTEQCARAFIIYWFYMASHLSLCLSDADSFCHCCSRRCRCCCSATFWQLPLVVADKTLRCAVTLIATDALPKIHCHIASAAISCAISATVISIFHAPKETAQGAPAPLFMSPLSWSFELLSSHKRLNNTLCCGRPPSDHNSWLHAYRRRVRVCGLSLLSCGRVSVR